jgi:hypothetical protein
MDVFAVGVLALGVLATFLGVFFSGDAAVSVFLVGVGLFDVLFPGGVLCTVFFSGVFFCGVFFVDPVLARFAFVPVEVFFVTFFLGVEVFVKDPSIVKTSPLLRN